MDHAIPSKPAQRPGVASLVIAAVVLPPGQGKMAFGALGPDME